MTGGQTLLEVGVLRHTRSLVAEGTVLVDAGQAVEPQDIVAETELLPGAPYFVDLKNLLKLREWDREAGAGMILKSPGDPVAVREPLARRRAGLLGDVVEAQSPVSGTVEWVSAARGEMMIREDARSAEPVVAVNVARRLDIWPGSVRSCLQVREGQEVRAGGLLAAVASSLGVDSVYAPVEGRVERVDPGTGIVYIVRPSRVSRLPAAFPGTVAEVVPGFSLTIETRGARLWGAFGGGRLSWGRLVPLADDDPLLKDAPAEGRAPELPPEWRGAVLACRGQAGAALLRRARQAGAAALVAGSASADDLRSLWGVAPERAGDDVEPSVVLTEGFGRHAMDERLWRFIAESAGATATVDPTTQVRAGSLRPEIVLAGPRVPLASGGLRMRVGEASAGDLVRVVRGAARGRYGRVEEYLDRHRFPSGVVAPALRLRLLPGPGGPESRDVVALDNVVVIDDIQREA